MNKVVIRGCLFTLTMVSLVFAQTTGKIAGTVTDAATDEKLVGVTVVVQGTNIGASTDMNGYYAILNLAAGTYTLKASMVGYSPTTVQDVRVSIDQTAEIDLKLSEAAVTGKEVTIVASRPVIQKDVSASTINLTPDEVISIPTVSITGAVQLQAGIQSGLVIRGGGNDQTAFMVDGFTLRDARSNAPYTNVSMTSVQDIQVQTGGFNAEYGDVRSGVVNVTTNNGSTEHYTISLLSRVAPPQPQNFGGALNGVNTYYVRPYMDPAVAYYGTSDGMWNPQTQSIYPTFPGWIATSEQSLAGGDSSKFLSPTAAQKLWEWQHRKDFSILKPNYNIDASFGGPFPVISKELGNLRFWASYVSEQDMYMIPLATDAYRSYSGSLKMTSDVGPGMSLQLEGMLVNQDGTNSSNAGQPGIFSSSSGISSVLSEVSYIDARMFTDEYWAPTKVNFNMIGAKFSDVVSPSTFYEINLRETGSQYHTAPGPLRDTASIYQFGNYYFADEAPVGFWPLPSTAIDGMRMSVGMSTSRDSSRLAEYNAKFDLSSQIDEHNQIKTGLEFDYTDNDVNYATVDAYLPTGTSWSHWHTFPLRASAYLQDKIEFEGMIANLGVRVDDSHAGGEWYSIDNPYSIIFSGADVIGLDTVTKAPTKNILYVEPRLGISFPVTDNSKLYFNYGHFYSMPNPNDLYLIRRLTGTNNVSLVADPNNPLPRTIAYELGFEQSVLDQYLIHIAGYYKDIANQYGSPDGLYAGTTYVSADSKVDYTQYTPNYYEDIRGFEITLSKNRGDWFQGFVNYTYMVETWGNFGYRTSYQSPADQRNYDLTYYTDLYQTKPLPQPYARLNLDFFTPNWFGPNWNGIKPLADWHVNLLGNWSAGPWLTWSGGATIPGVQNNVEWTDYLDFDLRISRGFHFYGLDMELFADIYNIFNYKYMSPYYGFYNGTDFNAYMESLHLPVSIAGDSVHHPLGYVNTPGNDRPGDYQSSSKSYIRMPELWQLSMLNPRTFFYGIRFTYDIP
ncbi:MAG TPA: TonB-dependent receptor [Candidatus Acidoferrales bacterium]|nr:TonB-dependent receptor [Candidatus Acidoferrales bacterium]